MSSINKNHCPVCWDCVDELFYYEDFGFEICLVCKKNAEKRKKEQHLYNSYLEHVEHDKNGVNLYASENYQRGIY